MPKFSLVNRNGTESVLDAKAGFSIMEAIRDSGNTELLAMCGGCCSCATCHVYLEDGLVAALPAMSADEDSLLDSSSHRQPNSRLSCQVIADDAVDGSRVVIAPDD